MRLRLAVVLVVALGSGAAYGQQAQSPPGRTGGTCSGYAAACMRYCEGRPNTRCSRSCEDRRASCMQTGIYERGMSSPITNVERR